MIRTRRIQTRNQMGVKTRERRKAVVLAVADDAEGSVEHSNLLPT